MIRRLHRDERGQSLVIVLALITLLFLVGSAMAAHATVALRAAVAGDAQAGQFNAADAGAELGIWWQRNGRSGNPPTINVNGTGVTTTIGTTGGSACTPPTPMAMTGFEHGAVSADGGGLFASVTGSRVSPDSAVTRSGGWSLKILNNNGSAHNVVLAVDGAVLVARVYLRLEVLPSADVIELLTATTAAGDDLRLGYRAADQRLTLAFGAASPASSASPVGAGTWYRLDLRLNAGTNPRSADWQIDGVAQAPTTAAVAPSTATALRLGSANGSDIFIVNFDDVMASVTSGDYPIGPGAILALRPDGVGTNNVPGSFRHEDGSAIDATTHLRLDDDPMTSSADYVRQQVVGASSYIELGFEDTSATCIAGVSAIVAYHSGSASGNAGKTSIFDGSTERVLFSGDMARPSLVYRSAVLPQAGGWTAGAVNALRARAGYSTDVNPNPYWDSLLLEVATASSGPGMVTVTATAGSSTVVTTYIDAGAAAPALLTWSASR